MKKAIFFYLAGVVSVLAFAYRSGADALIQAGLKLNAAQQYYVYDAQPAHVVDEQVIVAELARPVSKKGKR